MSDLETDILEVMRPEFKMLVDLHRDLNALRGAEPATLAEVSLGTFYVTVDRLEEQKLVETEQRELTLEEMARRGRSTNKARYARITETGIRQRFEQESRDGSALPGTLIPDPARKEDACAKAP